MKIADYEVHPAAKLFPMLPQPELKELAADIRKHGLLFPIILFDSMVLDGRNRLVACGMAGVNPEFEKYHGDIPPTEYVLSTNLHRRQLTITQRATVAAEALPMLEAEARERQGHRSDITEKIPGSGEARHKAAELAKVNPRYVSDAKRIKEQSPKLFQQMAAGDKSISQAKQELRWEQGVNDTPKPAEHAPEDDDSDNVWNLKRLWRKCKKQEKAEFLKWLQKSGVKLPVKKKS